MSKVVKVIASTMDDYKFTMFLDDGSIKYIQQGSKLLTKELVAKVSVDVMQQGYSMVTLEEEVITPNLFAQAYANITNHSEGSIKFFKAAQDFYEKHKGDIHNLISLLVDQGEPAITEKDNINSKTAIHAVVDNNKIVPNVNQIEDIIINAGDNTQGVTMLIKRMAAVESERNHTSQDIIDFLKTTKLPITNRGNIIFFKSVYKTSVEGEFVDCHTREVKQYVGSLVKMDPSLVDPSRKNECSNGLHIASIEYVTRFSGDSILIGIVHPEDIIAVPQYDHTKVRTSAYSVLAVMPKEDRATMYKSASIENCSPEFKRLLQGIVEDNYAPPRKVTTILSQNPQKIQYSSAETGVVEVTGKMTDNPDIVAAPAVTVREAATEIAELKPVKDTTVSYAKTKVIKPKKSLTHKENFTRLVSMFDKEQVEETSISLAVQIMQLKRKLKLGWDVLGVTKDKAEVILEYSKK